MGLAHRGVKNQDAVHGTTQLKAEVGEGPFLYLLFQFRAPTKVLLERDSVFWKHTRGCDPGWAPAGAEGCSAKHMASTALPKSHEEQQEFKR